MTGIGFKNNSYKRYIFKIKSHSVSSVFQILNLQVEEFEDIKCGYKLKFFFDLNPFFENSEIIKEFNYTGPEPDIITTEVKWKPGKKQVHLQQSNILENIDVSQM